MRALAEVGGNASGMVSGAAPGMPEVFAALEVLGTELVHAGSPVGDGVPSLDWQVEGVGGVSASTAVAGDGDPEAQRWLLPDGAHVRLFELFAFCNVSSFLT